MGSVKIDLYSSNLKYNVYSLSDIDVVELLLRFRYKYDPYLYLQANNNFTQAGDIEPLNAEAIALFQDLDKLIESAKLTDYQLRLVRLVQDGYTLEQMAEIMDSASKTIISRRLKAIYKKLVEKNLWDWRKVTYTNVLELKNKKCSKCKENLPATAEFFRGRSDNKGDGFYNNCKKCEE